MLPIGAAFRRLLAKMNRPGLVAMAGLMATASIAVVAATPSAANADYYWGCTYTFHNGACFQPGPPGVINRLWTMSPDEAYSFENGRSTNNGYPKARWDGRERDVCGAVYNGGVTVPWSCAWEISQYNLPQWFWGTALIGSQIESYVNVALYQDVNVFE